MSELRWHPFLEEWVVTATHRQERPVQESGSCPFCVGAPEVPKNFDVLCLPNRFPPLQSPAPIPSVADLSFSPVKPSAGFCEIVVFSPEHSATLSTLPESHIQKIVWLWQARTQRLGEHPQVDYVLIFENKGDTVGATLAHPHGQIYALPFIPPQIERHLASSRKFFKKTKKCLHCNVIREEKKLKERVVFENKHILAFVPFYARWPYEVHLYPKKHISSLLQMNRSETVDFAQALKKVTSAYDNLFSFPFPYMMVLLQAPTHVQKYPFFHFHIEFYPPARSATKMKYPAGAETGAGTFINDTLAEEKAKELRKACSKKPDEKPAKT